MVDNKYRAYLKSKAWEQKRQQVFNFYGRRCYACKTYRGPIQVHHLTYERLGRERMSDLRPLCRTCHREVTRLHWKMGRRKYDGFQVFQKFMSVKGNK